MGIHSLQSIAKIAPYVVFDTYDAFEQASLLDRVAVVFDNTTLLANPLKVQWVGARWQLVEWTDERTTQAIFRHDFHIEDRAWELTVEFDRLDYLRPESVAKAVPILENMAKAFSRGKMKIAMEVIRANPKAWDGRPLFDSAHKIEGTKKTYSNVLQFPFENAAEPKLEELASAVHEAFARLVENGAVDAELVDMSTLDKNLLVIAHNSRYVTQLEKLRTKERLGASDNELQGRFSLLYDVGDPHASTAFEVIYSDVTAPAVTATDRGTVQVGAPRPIFFKKTLEPTEVETDESGKFKNRQIQMGMYGVYSAKAGWPNVAVQVIGAGGG